MSRLGRVVMGLVFLGIGVLLLRETQSVELSAFADASEMGTMTYPRFLIWGWLAVSAVYLVTTGSQLNTTELRESLPGLLKCVAAIAFYIWSFGILGLFVSTFCFLAIFFYIMDYRKPMRLLPFSILGAALAWLVFEKVLGVVLPAPFWMGLW